MPASEAEGQSGTTGRLRIVGALLFGGVALAGLGLSMGTAQAFDPQPDPPALPGFAS